MIEAEKTSYVTDGAGKKIAVILPIGDYEKMKQELEMIDDIIAYDKAKKEDDGTRIAFEDHLAERGLKREDFRQ